MKAKDIKDLFERIKRQYNTFGYDDLKVQEWYKFLKDYSTEDVNDNFDKYILEYHDRPPLMNELFKNLHKTTEEAEEKLLWVKCDLCGESILVGNDWGEFNKHYRRCQKIDFIDRQAKEKRGEGIDKEHFRSLNDNELDEKYRKWMDGWEQKNKDLDLSKLFQRL